MDRNHWHLPQVEGSLSTTNREPDALTRIAAALERRVEQEDGALLRERSHIAASVAYHNEQAHGSDQFAWSQSELAAFDAAYPWIAAKAEASGE